MLPAENKTVIRSFVEEVINQGQLERADDLVAVDFLELDPLPGQQQGCEGLKEVIRAFRTAWCHFRVTGASSSLLTVIGAEKGSQ
jgi:hypothetical protein